MAKPKKTIRISATIGDLCFYQRNGKTFLREARALDRKLVLNDERFEKTMQFANKMGLASKIASEIYKDLPRELKARWIFRSITGHAASLLYKDMHPEEVKERLHAQFISNPQEEIKEAEKATYRTAKNYRRSSADKMLRKLFRESWEKSGKRLSDFGQAWKDPRGYNADNIKRFNYPYEFLEDRIKNLQLIIVKQAMGETISKSALNKLLSE
jgi:hypothetical protein